MDDRRIFEDKRLVRIKLVELELTIELVNVLTKFREEFINHKCFTEEKCNVVNEEKLKMRQLQSEYNQIMHKRALLTCGNLIEMDEDDGTMKKTNKKRVRKKIDATEKTAKKRKNKKTNNIQANENGETQAADKSKAEKQTKIKIRVQNYKRYGCCWPGCSFKVDRKSRLLDHMNSHTGLKPYHCEFNGCEKSFRTKQHLEGHHKLVHQSLKRIFGCPHENCDKKFKTKDCLRIHARKHTTRFACDHEGCTFRGADKGQLIRHSRKHLPPEQREPLPKLFKCSWEDCEKSYCAKKSLEDHMLTHTGQKRNLKCSWPECDKQFTTYQGLRIHTLAHLGKKDKKCDYPGCDFSAIRLSQITRHKQFVHEPYMSRKCKCEWPGCGKLFVTKAQLDIHFRTHNGNKHIPCEWPGCGMMFIQRGNMKKHMKIHQKNE